MSPAKKAIMDRIIPEMESLGYRYYKSSTTFSKKENELDYRIGIRFDGRGGLTMVDHLQFSIESPKYNRLVKKLVGDTSGSLLSADISAYCNGQLIIPVPYSREALDIANDMNMSKLSQLPLDRKYPAERLTNAAKYTLLRIHEHAFPFFEENPSLESIFDRYINDPESEDHPLGISRYRRRISGNKLRVLFCLLMAQELERSLPPILLKYKHYYADMISGFGYMGLTQDLKKNLADMGILYKPK